MNNLDLPVESLQIDTIDGGHPFVTNMRRLGDHAYWMEGDGLVVIFNPSPIGEQEIILRIENTPQDKQADEETLQKIMSALKKDRKLQ